MAYTLTKKALLLDLYSAFFCAKRHKSNKPYVLRFEKDLNANLRSLCDDLYYRVYKPEPSSCFIVERPKKREVFAAQFRDRVVHHLYYNYTHELYERTFIEDCYSCIPGRGTMDGVERMAMHIRKESMNYQRECYALKLDKRGYFMHIDRERLNTIAAKALIKMSTHKIAKGCHAQWDDVLDMDFILWLTKEIVMLDPKQNCHMAGNIKDWDGLDHNKSLFYTNDGCGLPIGNLTSQLLSNVYLNVFDQYMKRELGCKHYGRYVDDSYIISTDKEWLMSLVPKIRTFLSDNLGLELHMGKLHLIEVRKGVEFLGAFIKPHRIYVSRSSLWRTWKKVLEMDYIDSESVWRSVNSFLGIIAHYSSFNIRCEMFMSQQMLSVSNFDCDMTKMNKPNNYFINN